MSFGRSFIVGAAAAFVSASAALAGLPAPTPTEIELGQFELRGAFLQPPVNSPAFGLAYVRFDPATNIMTYEISHINLTSPELFKVMTTRPFELGGEIGGPIDPPGLGGADIINFPRGQFVFNQIQLTPLQGQDLLAGRYWVVIGSENFPGGEIAGRIIPAPGSAALLGLGLLTAARRRTRA